MGGQVLLRPSAVMVLVLIGSIMLFLSGRPCHAQSPDAVAVFEVELHPTPGFQDAVMKSDASLPFHETVPLGQGEVKWGGGTGSLAVDGQPITGYVQPINYWPDGSVRLLWVRGLWPGDRPIDSTVRVQVTADTPGEKADENTDGGLRIKAQRNATKGHVLTLHRDGMPPLTLRPEAGLIRLTQAKEVPDTNHPDYWDSIGQYLWAQPAEDVAVGEQRVALAPRVRDIKLERETPLYQLYRVRGDGGADSLGSDLEWMLRVYAYKGTSLLRFELTWKVFWDTQSYGLTHAKLAIDLSDTIERVDIPGIASDLSGQVKLVSTPDAQFAVYASDEVVAKRDDPSHVADGWLMRGGQGWWGLAVPELTMRGPSGVTVDHDGVTVATWSDDAGQVLDLRRSVSQDEPGMGDESMDFHEDISAQGMAFTTRCSLFYAVSREAAEATVASERGQEGLWFAPPSAYISTQAMGPWRAEALEQDHYIDGLRANLLFLVRSQTHWRWTGLINYGDVRTDFARGTDADRGFYSGRWLFTGRYGWRNGAAQPYAGTTMSGLFLGNREMLEFSRRYALHVADIDTRNPRFNSPSLPRTGGTHRRNKNHWSGVIQMQYTPSWALYAQYWLTGEERINDVLASVRQFATEGDNAVSLYAASAWINHYAQTHEPQSKAVAIGLFNESIRKWRDRVKDAPVEGATILYYNNFRRTIDAHPILVELHQATGDKRFLEALYGSTMAHDPLSFYLTTLDAYIAPAYLLAHGYTREQLGEERLQALENQFREYRPDVLPTYSAGDYETVADITLEKLPPRGNSHYRRSAFIGWRGVNAPLVLSVFDGREEDSIQATPSP